MIPVVCVYPRAGSSESVLSTCPTTSTRSSCADVTPTTNSKATIKSSIKRFMLLPLIDCTKTLRSGDCTETIVANLRLLAKSPISVLWYVALYCALRDLTQSRICNMVYDQRLQQFRQILDADLAFFPISSDLQYLTGIPRDIPNFGATIHPGAWLEGAWITPTHDPVLTLPRMTAEFGGLERLSNVQLRVLGDWDDPATLVRDVLKGFSCPPRQRLASALGATAERVFPWRKLHRTRKLSLPPTF